MRSKVFSQILVGFCFVTYLTETSATFEWLSDFFGTGSSHRGRPGFGGNLMQTGGRQFGGRPFGTSYGSGSVGGNSGVHGGSEYLGGGWTGSGSGLAGRPNTNFRGGHLGNFLTGRNHGTHHHVHHGRRRENPIHN